MLEIRTLKSDAMTEGEITALNTIAARGFGRTSTEDMLDDTRAHLLAASTAQIAYSHERPVAFALYKERLWRPGY